MAQFLAPIINSQQEDANGNPLSGGKIYVYLAGSSTPVTTYSDKAGLVPNTNPLTLNTLGVSSQGAVWLTGGVAYKYVIQDASLVTQRTIDNVSGINDTTVTTDQWLVYAAAPTYVSATSFTVAGDQTQTFQVGRRVKTTNTGGTVYSIITNVVYGAPNTTVTVANDSGVLDAGLSAVSYSILSVLQTSLPGGLPTYGQCRLTKSGANLVLSPYGGNKITVNGQICTIPAAGVSLAPTSLSVTTLYYIYAYIAAGGLALEASVTTHATDATTGVEIKSGDATRTLVGMARTIAGPAWTDTGIARFVLSWFNRRELAMSNGFAANQASSNTSYVEILSGAKNEFITWSGGLVRMGVTGGVQNSTALAYSFTSVGIDGATPQDSFSVFQGSAVSQAGPIAVTAVNDSLSEGYHYMNIIGQVSAGTGTWLGGLSGARSSITGSVFG